MDSIDRPTSDKPMEAGASDAPASERASKWRTWKKRAAMTTGIVLSTAGINLLVCFLEGNSLWMLRLGFAAATGTLLYCVLSGYWRRWVQPADRLAATLCEIRAGQAPIEELSKIGGGLESVAFQAKSLLGELRQYKQQLAQLDLEIRHKVASRTDALERLIGSLRHQANRDTLTGLYNRRMLDQLLPQLVRQCLAEGTPLAIQMIDVDYFKDLNDTLGHPAGDEMLRALGQIIRSTIRASDFGFRFGGDEFAILMPGCGKEAAQGIADRLQSLALAMTGAYRLARRPGLSIGVCTLAELADPTPENLIHRADVLLYEKKQIRREAAKAKVAQAVPERKAV
jgi:diguanylate cyclase (GGDEF)-like protein